jgi:hypothetical protein
MPAFTFEKISPEKISPETRSQARRGQTPDARKEPRGVIFRVFGRLNVLRVKRRLRGDDGAIAGREQKPRD